MTPPLSPRRVFLLGGTGVFGARIGRLLAGTVDSAEVVVGRTLAKAERLAAELRARVSVGAAAQALAMNRDHDTGLDAALRSEQAALLIDALGPFQVYGGYDVARAFIAHRVSYADIADGRAFVAGIRALDADARSAGVPVLSGVSSAAPPPLDAMLS